MKKGFSIPQVSNLTSAVAKGNLGFYHISYVKDGSNVVGLTSTMTDEGISFIVFAAITLAVLIAGFVVHAKGKIHTNKCINIGVASSFTIFAIALILALIAKVNVSMISYKTTSLNLSI
jgi:hypothetical protein